jgi:hypothetical protein
VEFRTPARVSRSTAEGIAQSTDKKDKEEVKA